MDEASLVLPEATTAQVPEAVSRVTDLESVAFTVWLYPRTDRGSRTLLGVCKPERLGTDVVPVAIDDGGKNARTSRESG